MSNLFDLSQEVAVIIGATGVLGGALAEGLAAAGAKGEHATISVPLAAAMGAPADLAARIVAALLERLA